MMAGYAKVDFDSVAPLGAVDKTASLVTSKGNHVDLPVPKDVLHSENPIPYRAPTSKELGNPSFKNFISQQIDRLKVLGIQTSQRPKHNKGQAWVCRCVCGRYEIRRTKFLNKFLDGDYEGQDPAMCTWCDYNVKLKMGFGKGIPNQKGTA